jgi:hydrogenase maturation protease
MSDATAIRPRLLIAGVGNIFLGDDAFGVEVVQRLARWSQPDGVRVVDFGIRGLDLAYALLDDYDAVILVDAVPRGDRPGTLYVLEIDPPEVSATGPELLIEAHHMDPVKVLRLATSLGGKVRRLFLVGCEPEPPAAPEDMQMGLSAPVQAAVDEAISLVEGLAERLLRGERVSGAVVQ